MTAKVEEQNGKLDGLIDQFASILDSKLAQ